MPLIETEIIPKVITTPDKVIPTREETEVLEGYTFGMSTREIAISMDIPVVKVSQHIGNLYEKWHGLEDMGKNEDFAAVQEHRRLQIEKRLRPRELYHEEGENFENRSRKLLHDGKEIRRPE